jgi:RNA polymerase sigma-70 factor (ECF subfamily)
MNSIARRGAQTLATSEHARLEARTLQAITRAKQGDRQAVRFLCSQYGSVVRAYLGSLLRDPDLVDDVVQTTFLKLLTRIDRYEPREVPFEAWLLRVARNAAFDELRRRRRGDSRPIVDEDGVVVSADELTGELWEALERLPASGREVLVLRHVVGLSVGEVAERMGTTPQAVTVLLERSCATLRSVLRGDQPVAVGAAPAGRFSRGHRPLIQQLG